MYQPAPGFGDDTYNFKAINVDRKSSVKTPNDRLIEDPTESWSQIPGSTTLSANYYIIQNSIRLFPIIPKTFATRHRASFLILAKRSQYLEVTFHVEVGFLTYVCLKHGANLGRDALPRASAGEREQQVKLHWRGVATCA